MSGPRTVVVADDHPLFRRGLVEALSADGVFRVAGEAQDGDQALALVASHRPDVAILDIDMPKKSGIEVAQAIREAHPSVRVILLTMHKSRAMLEGALDAGAKGYVLKENAVTDILACLNLVAEGGTYISPGVAHHLVERRGESRVEDPIQQALGTLTSTERAVLRLISAGHTTREIAAELDVKAKTVEHHRSSICLKLGVTGINALVRFAAEHRRLLT